MTHWSDDDLILHYYGDGESRGGAEDHLESCAECAGRYRDLVRAMQLFDAADVPARDDRYGLEVWQRIRHRLPEREASRWPIWAWGNGLALAGLAVLLVAVGFLAGRVWRPAADGPVMPAVASRSTERPDDSRRRVLLISVAEHFDRSDRVLTDIMNAADGVDISAEQQWAEDLLWTGRLYRQNAMDAEEQSVVDVLDDLERTLLDIVHSPSRVTGAQLEEMRRRVDSAALLFKVRVMRNELQQRRLAFPDREEPPVRTSQTS